MTERSRERYDRFFAEGGAPVQRWGEPEEVGRVVAALLARAAVHGGPGGAGARRGDAADRLRAAAQWVAVVARA